MRQSGLSARGDDRLTHGESPRVCKEGHRDHWRGPSLPIQAGTHVAQPATTPSGVCLETTEAMPGWLGLGLPAAVTRTEPAPHDLPQVRA